MTESPTMLPFNDLQAQHRRIAPQIDAAIGRVLAHGRYILGPEVSELEEALASRCGATYCLGCASGTDALLMVLMAWGTGSGDAVFLPSFTFASTAEVVALLGATPVFVDVDESTFNISPSSLEDAIGAVAGSGLRSHAIIGVDLFGLPADWGELRRVASDWNLRLLADSAQSFGAAGPEGSVGTLADASITSFFPAKPLGCYGDGGAIFTDDADLAGVLRSIRVHGQGDNKYDNVRIGINGRLDTIQAAILLQKLKIFDDELEARNRAAERYLKALKGLVLVQSVPDGYHSTWAQYTIRTPHRSEVRAALAAVGIPSAIYYPKPLHLQGPYASAQVAPGGLPVTQITADEVLSVPMHPYLSSADQSRVANVISAIVR